MFQWFLRILGYGLNAAGVVLATKGMPELGGCASAVGSVLLNKATPAILPKNAPPPQK